MTLTTLFGPVPVASPYLYRAGHGARPVEAFWGIHGGSHTMAVERALTDFGIEESFGQAAIRFREHYGFEVGRTSISKVVHRHARRALAYVEALLQSANDSFEKPTSERAGIDAIVVQLDGCEIRTGTLTPIEGTTERTEKRGLLRRVRTEHWRDVRVGLARPRKERTPTYIAKMAPYSEVTNQLFSAACLCGLTDKTAVTGVADGGNGLYEALSEKFSGLRFILDRPHAKQHLYETADACGLQEQARHQWVAKHITLLDMGKVDDVLTELAAHKGRGKARVQRLHGYITRFKKCFDYDAAKKEGLPIGSGEVESAHRTIPQKRMKLPGAWWHPDSINPFLALRIVRANDWWNDLWKNAA